MPSYTRITVDHRKNGSPKSTNGENFSKIFLLFHSIEHHGKSMANTLPRYKKFFFGLKNPLLVILVIFVQICPRAAGRTRGPVWPHDMSSCRAEWDLSNGTKNMPIGTIQVLWKLVPTWHFTRLFENDRVHTDQKFFLKFFFRILKFCKRRSCFNTKIRK